MAEQEAWKGDPALLQTLEGRPQTPGPAAPHTRPGLRAARGRRLVQPQGVDARRAASGPGMGRGLAEGWGRGLSGRGGRWAGRGGGAGRGAGQGRTGAGPGVPRLPFRPRPLGWAGGLALLRKIPEGHGAQFRNRLEFPKTVHSFRGW